MLKEERFRDYLAFKVVNLFQATFKARLMDKLPFYIDAKFCDGIKCYVSSSKELKRSKQEFDPQVYEWLKSFSSGDCFYDIGANIGMFSLSVASIYNKNVQVYAFEPSFSTFASLMQNVAVNQLDEIIHSFSVALGSMNGMRNFNYKNLVAGESVHTLDAVVNQMGSRFVPAFCQQVASYTLDGFIEDFELPLPTHIKIDVDGGEWEVLQGMRNLLGGDSIKSVMVEITEQGADNVAIKEIYDLFFESGFKDALKILHRNNKNTPIISDVLFTKNWAMKK